MLRHELRTFDVRHAREQSPASREGADAYEFARLKVAAAAEERRRPSITNLMAEIEAERRLEDSEIQEILQSEAVASAVDLRIGAIPGARGGDGPARRSFCDDDDHPHLARSPCAVPRQNGNHKH